MKLNHSSANSFSELIRYIYPWRGKAIFASTCSVLNKIFDIAPEVLIGVAVDLVVEKENSFVASLGAGGCRITLYKILRDFLGVLTSLCRFNSALSYARGNKIRQYYERLDLRFKKSLVSIHITYLKASPLPPAPQFSDWWLGV